MAVLRRKWCDNATIRQCAWRRDETGQLARASDIRDSPRYEENGETMTDAGLTLLTCSIERDRDIFAVLAKSIDENVDPSVRHVVVVPGKDVRAFAPFASPQRDIVAQEDILPIRLFQLPKQLRALSFLSSSFRRPIYLTPKLRPMRGWMIQQILKIEFARTCPTPAVMHVDSDVFFVRGLQGADAYRQGKVTFFEADSGQPMPQHRPWIDAAAACLGLSVPPTHARHYIENCVMWDRDVTRDMVARIEAQTGRFWVDALLDQPTISEYFIYGLYIDYVCGPDRVAVETQSYCNSFWPEQGAFEIDQLLARLKPKHCAFAVQSTEGVEADARLAVYDAARRALS